MFATEGVAGQTRGPFVLGNTTSRRWLNDHPTGGFPVPRFKPKKGVNLGGLAAETDPLLNQSFVDVGYVQKLMDPSNPVFLIIGRTGSGKTALIERIRSSCAHVSALDPDELSMQYLHNSVLRTVAGWGVNLDIFFKYLWRHVCILELVRMRYGDADDVPSRIQQIFPIAQLFRTDRTKTKEASQQYLKDYGEDYWVKTDTRIKKITSEMEEKLISDEGVAAGLKVAHLGLSATSASSSAARAGQKIEEEVAERAQAIVSDFQIAALNRVVEGLEKYGFSDTQNPYFVVIDDLDTDWMPDDLMYLNLIKSLLFTVNELNRRLKSAKIVVALRENIFHRVFQKAEKHEPQREKWEDVQIKIRWSREDLVALVDKRLAEVYRAEYTQVAPTLEVLLPSRKRNRPEEAIDYILTRTFMRPRDLIDFINRCIEESGALTSFSWATLQKVEVGYSEARLKSVFDEWRDSYYGLPALFPVLKNMGSKFTISDITDEQVYSVLEHERCERCSWLRELANRLLSTGLSTAEIKVEFVKALYLVGIIGTKAESAQRVTYSFERAIPPTHQIISGAIFYVHKMFLSALGMNEPKSAETGS